MKINKIGFGAAYLTGGIEAKRNIDLVHVAYNLGVRHFDVAPVYGMGTAEKVLGRALDGIRNEVTICTKIGIPRHRASIGKLFAHAVYQPFRNFIKVNKISSRAANVSKTKTCFDIDFVRKSLEESLEDLRTDRIDIVLLHEVCDSDITDELIYFLMECRKNGVVGRLGLATDYDNSSHILNKYPSIFDVVQYSWNVFDIDSCSIFPDLLNITHRSINGVSGRVLEMLSEKINFNSKLDALIKMDEETIGNILLSCALINNPNGKVLYGTRNVNRWKGIHRVFDEDIIQYAKDLSDTVRLRGA